MERADLERLSKDELIELVLRLQRPEKTSRTSSKPPSTDKERREQARPGGAKPGHEGHSRPLAQDPDRVIEHRPTCCPDCGLVLPPDLPAETVSTHEHIELPPVRPVVEQHRRLAVTCPACQARVAAPRPAGAASTPFGARLHATAVSLKCFQALSYERLQRALSDLFGLTISQGGLMAMLRRAQARFAPGREAALSAVRRAAVGARQGRGGRGTTRACASRARTATPGCSAATRPWCITPPRRGRALWCARSWAGTGRPYGCRTVTPPSKVMRTGSRPAWRIWRATSPMRSKPATTRSRSASSCGSARPSRWRAGSAALRPQRSMPSGASWRRRWMRSWPRRARAVWRATARPGCGGRA